MVSPGAPVSEEGRLAGDLRFKAACCFVVFNCWHLMFSGIDFNALDGDFYSRLRET